MGGTPARSRQGVPQPGPDGGACGAYPSQVWMGGTPWPGMGYPPSEPGMGYPPSGPGMGCPPPPIWIRTWDGVPPPQLGQQKDTHYAAGGMPLAFTQDFLVYFCYYLCTMSTTAYLTYPSVFDIPVCFRLCISRPSTVAHAVPHSSHLCGFSIKLPSSPSKQLAKSVLLSVSGSNSSTKGTPGARSVKISRRHALGLF